MTATEEPPRFSVVIPTYQRVRIVPDAIDSALAQTVRSLEILVVDDGSKDGTAQALAARYAAEPRVRILTKANGGTASARNMGVDASRGAYIALLDSDDLFLPRHLEALAKPLEADPSIDLAVGNATYEGGWPRDGLAIFDLPRYYPPANLDDMCDGLWALPSAMLWRSSRLKALKFDEAVRWAEDTELLFRFFAEGGRSVPVREVVTRYRFQSGSAGAASKQTRSEFIQRSRLSLQERYASRSSDPKGVALRLHRRWIRQFRKTGSVKEAWPHAVAWWKARPWSPAPWVLLAKTMLVARRLRRQKIGVGRQKIGVG